MSENGTKDNILQPTSLHEAINIIKFLKTSHKQEMVKLREAYAKQTEVIKKLESNRKKELEFLSSELQKYEINLAIRTESVSKQLAQKDIIIQKQADTIEELNKKLHIQNEFRFSVPEINVLVDSNSDSGIALEHDESKTETKSEVKATRKCSRKFGETISFLRSRVDFSPMKYKPSNRDAKKKEDKKNHLQVPSPNHRTMSRQNSNEKSLSDDDRRREDAIHSDSGIEPVILRPKMNDSMNNHFSDDGSEDTSEELFDRVMTRSSVRRSVKANPKYKKINRCKSKLLEQVKINIVD